VNQFKALAVGGMPNHVHVLLSLPATMTIAKALQLIKGGSSKWINDHLERRSFVWQDAYAGFSIGISQVENTVRYINDQERHHKRMTIDEELSAHVGATWNQTAGLKSLWFQPSPKEDFV